MILVLTKEQMKLLQKEMREPIPEEIKERFRKAIEVWEKNNEGWRYKEK